MTISRNTYVAATSRPVDRRNGLRQKCFVIPRANSFDRYILQIIILHKNIHVSACQLLDVIKQKMFGLEYFLRNKCYLYNTYYSKFTKNTVATSCFFF